MGSAAPRFLNQPASSHFIRRLRLLIFHFWRPLIISRLTSFNILNTCFSSFVHILTRGCALGDGVGHFLLDCPDRRREAVTRCGGGASGAASAAAFESPPGPPPRRLQSHLRGQLLRVFPFSGCLPGVFMGTKS